MDTRGVIIYIKKCNLLKFGCACMVWILSSFVEVMIQNPYQHTPSKWNYFRIITEGLEGHRHHDETFCMMVHGVFVFLIIITIILYLIKTYKTIFRIYLISISIIIMTIIVSLIIVHDNVCMYIGFGLEIIYGIGIADELNNLCTG